MDHGDDQLGIMDPGDDELGIMIMEMGHGDNNKLSIMDHRDDYNGGIVGHGDE